MTRDEEVYLAHCLAVRQARERELNAKVADDWTRRTAAQPHYTVADHTTGPKGER